MEHLFYTPAEQGTEAQLPRQDAVVAPRSCRVMNRTHGGTMARENRSDRVMSTRRLRVSVRKGRRPLPMRLAPPGVRRSFAGSSSTPDRVALAHAVIDVRRALEEVAVATAEVAARVSSVAAALASLSGEEGRPELLGSSPTPGAEYCVEPAGTGGAGAGGGGADQQGDRRGPVCLPQHRQDPRLVTAAQAAGRHPRSVGRHRHQAWAVLIAALVPGCSASLPARRWRHGRRRLANHLLGSPTWRKATPPLAGRLDLRCWRPRPGRPAAGSLVA